MNKRPKVNAKPSQRLLKTLNGMVVDGLSIREAQRRAGYSKAYIRSSKIMKTLTYIECLNKIGLSDEVISAQVRQLSFSTKHEERMFPDKVSYKKDPSNPLPIPVYTPFSNDQIKKIIQSVPGCTVITIVRFPSEHKKVAYISVPNEMARKDGLSFLHKSKGLYSPDRFELDLSHNVSAEEKAAVAEALAKANGKKA